MVGRPFDPLPETTSSVRRTALRVTALSALLIATIAISPFWAQPMGRLLPWGGQPPAAAQDYAALAARLTEVEKRSASPSFDVEAIKSVESALARRIDQLDATLSRLPELPAAPPSNATAALTAPATSARLSNEETAALVPQQRAGISRPRRSSCSWRAVMRSLARVTSFRHAFR
jgi:hypothetical protein